MLGCDIRFSAAISRSKRWVISGCCFHLSLRLLIALLAPTGLMLELLAITRTWYTHPSPPKPIGLWLTYSNVNCPGGSGVEMLFGWYLPGVGAGAPGVRF